MNENQVFKFIKIVGSPARFKIMFSIAGFYSMLEWFTRTIPE
jgi:hypothetical protein